MSGFIIVETDNFGRDYPDEKAINIPPLPEIAAKAICEIINIYCGGGNAPRWWKVEESTYVLQPGFEP